LKKSQASSQHETGGEVALLQICICRKRLYFKEYNVRENIPHIFCIQLWPAKKSSVLLKLAKFLISPKRYGAFKVYEGADKSLAL
jgi:hypothetical protein